MKLLHTSDWHVGKTLRGRSRADEHRAVLTEIARVARDEAVDAILVVGDLFDTASPTAESEQIVYRALLDLAGTGAPVIVVSGNHDNERRLAAVQPLLDKGDVICCSSPTAPDAGGVVDLTTNAGERLRIALLPFVHQRSVVRASELMGLDADEHTQSYKARIGQLVGALAATFTTDAVNVIAAHLTIAGGEVGGGERAAHTIFDYYVDANVFPASAHYVALGHLHRPQRIPAPCPVWYCGSPLHLDFGEAAGSKCVLVVDATAGTPATAREVALASGRRLTTLRGTLAELEAHVGATGDDHLRIFVREPLKIGLADRVRELFPTAVDVIVEAPEAENTGRGSGDERPSRLSLAPPEQFAAYLADKGVDDDRLVMLFRDLLEEASTASAS